MNELVALASLAVGLLGLGVLRRFLRNRQRLRLYEMAHEERMLALEKGLPAADLPAGTYVFGAQDSGNNFYTILAKGK